MLTRIAPLAYCAVVLVVAGCVSGQVTDAVTGQPIVGATVTFYDDAKRTVGTTTTGDGGLYSFDGITSPKPTAGLVRFEVSAPGYATLGVQRDLQYDNNAEHTLAVENFVLVPGDG